MDIVPFVLMRSNLPSPSFGECQEGRRKRDDSRRKSLSRVRLGRGNLSMESSRDEVRTLRVGKDVKIVYAVREYDQLYSFGREGSRRGEKTDLYIN